MEKHTNEPLDENRVNYTYGTNPDNPDGAYTYSVSEKKKKKKKRVPLAVFIICVALALFLGAAAAGAAVLAAMGTFSPKGEGLDQNKINSLKRQIDKYYKGEYNEEDLVEGAYHGYVNGLGDKYSAYMTKEEYEQDLESYSGNYSGIGITFNQDDNGNFKISEVSEGSPAEKGGLKVGDYILTVDGVAYENMDIMAAHIRGETGTKVTIEYLHDGKEEKVELIREKIHQETVKHEMLDSETGLIEIDSFIETTGDDFSKALDDIESKGAKYLVLDLRNNGGGLVDECVKVADEFLDEGVICYVEDKNGKTETYDAKDGKTKLKTVVLVNENSASASEILSYALKDNGFSIIGEKTYGKGVIQVTLPQKDGSALELTIMEYLSPDKHQVHKKGVPPDVEVEDDPDTEKDEQLDKAKELIKTLK